MAPGTVLRRGSPASSPHPAVLHPCLALPRPSLVWWCHCPGQLSLDNSTWGRRPRKLEIGLQIICASFEENFFFTFCKDSFQPLVPICPSSPPHTPVIHSNALKTRRRCPPGSSEQEIVKSHNLSWMIPFKAERPIPHFTKQLSIRQLLLC